MNQDQIQVGNDGSQLTVPVASDGRTPPIIWRPALPLEAGHYPGFEPRTFSQDGIRVEHDVAVVVRDGTTLYVDVYRPEGEIKVPALVAWGNYGKRGGIWSFDMFPDRVGVPAEATNEWTKFEGPNPVWWVKRGYAVVNPDARGSWKSEGDLRTIGGTEAEDAYDVIEWTAGQDWSSGKVGMTGSSWLGMSQWFVAALNPPHLAAISPWEGWSDTYRETVAVGGIVTDPNAMEWLWEPMFGEGRVEDVPAMAVAHPLWNDYWESKRAKLEQIEIPAYIVASWTHNLHPRGTFEGFKHIRSTKKWLRVHNTMEWPDYYTPENMEELKRFFDRFLKDLDNDWEEVPAVRLALLDDTYTAVQRVEETWPIARTQHKTLYLSASNGILAWDKPDAESAIGFDPADGVATFSIRFGEDTELSGNMSLQLWAEVSGADDMDLFVDADKVDADGKRVGYFMLGGPVFPAAHGALRASHRELDPEHSLPQQPRHLHQRELKMTAGEIVLLNIEFWPLGLYLHEGEELRISIGGKPFNPGLTPFPIPEKGTITYTIHTGGRFDSHLLIPHTPLRE